MISFTLVVLDLFFFFSGKYFYTRLHVVCILTANKYDFKVLCYKIGIYKKNICIDLSK